MSQAPELFLSAVSCNAGNVREAKECMEAGAVPEPTDLAPHLEQAPLEETHPMYKAVSAMNFTVHLLDHRDKERRDKETHPRLHPLDYLAKLLAAKGSFDSQNLLQGEHT